MRHNNIVLKFLMWENTGWVKTDRLFFATYIHCDHSIRNIFLFTHTLILKTVTQQELSILLNARIGKTCDLGNFEHDMIADGGSVSCSSCGIFLSTLT